MNKNQISVDTFNKLAKQYQDKYMSLDLYDDTFDVFCNLVTPQNGQILELGCGPGNITQYLLKRHPEYKILGTDLSPNMIELAKINNPDAEFQVMDCRDINRITESYDAIMCGFCLPYLSNQEAVSLITDAAILLSAGGVIYISTMEDDYEKSALQTASSGEQVYIYYHQCGFLIEHLKAQGFEIKHVQRKDYAEKDGAITIDLFITAQRQ